MQSERVRLESDSLDIDPVELGARSGLLWSRDGLVLAGAGATRRIAIERPTGAEQAQQRLVAAAGQVAIAFAALPFDREAPGELVVPEVVIERDRSGTMSIITTGVSLEDGLGIVERTLAEAPGSQPSNYELASVVPPEVWRDEVVTSVRDRIASGEVDKVVLARELAVTTDHAIDVAAVLNRLHQSFSTAIIFAVDGFIGATPELLVSRSDTGVHAHPLAGTAPRSSDPDRDAELAAALNISTKDQSEHRITIDWLLDTLLPYCSYVDAEPEPAIITLPNVHHLGTLVEGRLSAPPVSVLELVAALHPTPAVGGSPQDLGLKIIEADEPGDRGLYAGPVGWVDGAVNGEFAVGIRSATIDGNTASVWAGVGVVADSDPVAELAETRAKFQAMLGALVRP